MFETTKIHKSNKTFKGFWNLNLFSYINLSSIVYTIQSAASYAMYIIY